MPIFVCGSLAFDTTMVLDNKLRVSGNNSKGEIQAVEADFSVPNLRRDYGGCAGNIVYNLKMLGIDALPVGTVGTDFNTYRTWLEKRYIDQRYIKVIEHSYTAHTYITIDMDDNRITAFHPGAMVFSHFNRMNLNAEKATMGVIGSDGEDGMRIHADQFTEANVPFLYYPSHSMQKMLEDEWLHLIEQSTWTLLSEEQCSFMEKSLNITAEQMSLRVQALIVNQGKQGARIYHDGLCHYIPKITPQVSYDASGADDAFCAGIIYGLSNDIDWDTTGRLASLIKVIKIEHHGTQQHSLSLEQLKQRFQEVFNYALLTPSL
jgi:adenosine kinase